MVLVKIEDRWVGDGYEHDVTLAYADVTITVTVAGDRVVDANLPEAARKAILENPVEALWLVESVLEALRVEREAAGHRVPGDPFADALAEVFADLASDEETLRTRNARRELQLVERPRTVRRLARRCGPEMLRWFHEDEEECVTREEEVYEDSEAEKTLERLAELRRRLVEFLASL